MRFAGLGNMNVLKVTSLQVKVESLDQNLMGSFLLVNNKFVFFTLSIKNISRPPTFSNLLFC